MFRRLLGLPLFALLGVAVAWVPSAGARSIYKWTAPDGTTHYGEAPPASGIAAFEVINVEPAPPAANAASAADDYRSTLELADRLKADRLERERLRLEKERLELKARQERQQQARDEGPTYIIPYYSYPWRPYPRPRPYGQYRWHPPAQSPSRPPPPPGPYDIPKRFYPPR